MSLEQSDSSYLSAVRETKKPCAITPLQDMGCHLENFSITSEAASEIGNIFQSENRHAFKNSFSKSYPKRLSSPNTSIILLEKENYYADDEANFKNKSINCHKLRDNIHTHNKSEKETSCIQLQNSASKYQPVLNKINTNAEKTFNSKFETVNSSMIEKHDDSWKHNLTLDKKLPALQSQVPTSEQQDNVLFSINCDNNKCCNHTSETVTCNSKQCDKSQLLETNQSFIFMYLKELGEQVQKLQNQYDRLSKRTEELESFHSTKTKTAFTFESPVRFDANAFISSTKMNSVTADKICQTEETVNENKQIETDKISISTMTSLILENAEKHAVTNYQKDVQCLQENESIVANTLVKTISSDTDTPKLDKKCTSKHNKESTPKSADSKKQQEKFSKRESKSLEKIKKHALDIHKSPHINLNAQYNADLDSASPPLRAKPIENKRPLIDCNRGKVLINDRNVNDSILEIDDEINCEELPSSEKNHHKYNPRPPNSTKCKKNPCTCSKNRRSKYHKYSGWSPSESSNDSIISDHRSPQHIRNESEPEILNSQDLSFYNKAEAEYGLSSPNLTCDTLQFLHQHGLTRNSKSPINKESEEYNRKKAKTNRCKRQIV